MLSCVLKHKYLSIYRLSSLSGTRYKLYQCNENVYEMLKNKNYTVRSMVNYVSYRSIVNCMIIFLIKMQYKYKYDIQC